MLSLMDRPIRFYLEKFHGTVIGEVLNGLAAVLLTVLLLETITMLLLIQQKESAKNGT
jgi:hypothetical protein